MSHAVFTPSTPDVRDGSRRSALRVLVANDLYGPSSAAGMAVQQARRMAALGHEVCFLGTVQDRAEARSFTEPGGLLVRLIYAPPYSLRFRAWVSLWNRPAIKGLAKVLSEFKPDVVHFHNVHIHLSYRALKVARVHGAKVVLSVHDVMPFCFQKMYCFMGDHLRPEDGPVSFKAPFPRCIPCARFRYNPIRNPWIRWHFRRHASRLVAVSDEMRRALLENRIGNVEVIDNGIDPTLVNGPDQRAAFRAAHGLEGRKVVLYGGRLDHRKGAEHLIRALALICARVPEATLLVVGSGIGGYEELVLDLARELGVDDHVVTTGWLDQDQMAAAYQAVDVVCTPSLIFESFGLINAEGMLRGKPVVTSYFGGPKNVVEDGETGYHVNPLHVDRLADKLAVLLEDDELRETMGNAARARVLKRFNLEIQTDKTIDLYRRLVVAAGDRPEARVDE